MNPDAIKYFQRMRRSAAALSILLLCFATAPTFAGQLCGNAELDFNESCDDGNNDDGDGCTRLCDIETGWLCIDPYQQLDTDNGIVQDPGFEFGPDAAWENNSTVAPLVCTVDDCASEPAGARNGVGWAQFGGLANEDFRLRQIMDFNGPATTLKFDLKHEQCPFTGSNDQFRITINETSIFSSGASDLGCSNGGLYVTKQVNLLTAPGGPYDNAGQVEFALEVFTAEGDFKIAVDNIQIGKPAAPPVPSICTLDPNLSLYEPFEDINGPLEPPDFQVQSQGEFEIFWGTTNDGACGTAQSPPGNHTGEPGDAACIDTSGFFTADEVAETGNLLASNIETYVCKAPVDLSFKVQSQLQLVINYQPGPVTSQDFFGVWAGTSPFFGPLDQLGGGSARLLVNNPQGSFGQSPGVNYEFDISDLDGEPQVYVCFGYGNNNAGYAQVDTVILGSQSCTDDFEEDKILSCNDNCSEYENPSQDDSDNDGYGNACDADIAKNATALALAADNAPGNDCQVNFQDLFIFSQAMFSSPTKENWNPDADFNSDDIVNFLDLARFSELFLKEPGPSGVASTCSASET